MNGLIVLKPMSYVCVKYYLMKLVYFEICWSETNKHNKTQMDLDGWTE